MMMQQVDPLSNHVILEAIFKNLDATDLKAVRLVSSLWKEASLDSWRSTAVIVLLRDDDEVDGGRGKLTLSEFKEMITRNDGEEHAHLKLGSKPFSNYKLDAWSFNPEESKDEVDFLRDHGSLMKYLHMRHCHFDTFSLFEDLLTRRLPNLKKLVWSVWSGPQDHDAQNLLDSGDSDEDSGDDDDGEKDKEEVIFERLKTRLLSPRENFQRSLKVLEIRCLSESFFEWDSEYWTKLLCCMPEVKDVRLRIYKRENMEYLEYSSRSWDDISMLPFLRGLQWLTRLDRGCKIRKLDIMDFCLDVGEDKPGDKIFELPLEELSVDWGTDSRDDYNKKVLENIVDSLQVLKVFRAPEYSPSNLLALPGSMESLRELYLYGNVTENLAFLRFTPNLQVLVMNQFCYDQRHKLNQIVTDPQNVKFCTTDLVANTERELLRRKISEATLGVPSVEYLDVGYPVAAAGVPKLAKWLPNVKTLKMVMNNELLAASCKGWPKLEYIECHFRSTLDDGGVSTLVQCSELRKFKMNVLCGQATLTSSSVNQFLKISSLRELNVCTTDLVSEEVEATLLEKLMRGLKLIKNHHNNQGYECCEQSPFLQKVFRLVKVKVKGEVPVIAAPLSPRALRSGRVLRPK